MPTLYPLCIERVRKLSIQTVCRQLTFRIVNQWSYQIHWVNPKAPLSMPMLLAWACFFFSRSCEKRWMWLVFEALHQNRMTVYRRRLYTWFCIGSHFKHVHDKIQYRLLTSLSLSVICFDNARTLVELLMISESV